MGKILSWMGKTIVLFSLFKTVIHSKMNVFVAKNYLFYIEKVQANEREKKCFEKSWDSEIII